MNETIKNIVVNRDGQLDEEWLEGLEKEQRRAAIRQLPNMTLNQLTRLALSVVRLMVNLLRHIQQDAGYTQPIH